MNESISLAFNDLAQGGSSDKVYHMSLSPQDDDWIVSIQYGRRGSALMSQIKGADSYEKEGAKYLQRSITRSKSSDKQG